MQNSKTGTFSQRTDLADECLELCFKNRKPDTDGIVSSREKIGDIVCERLEIKNDEGAVKLGKPMGSYITLNIGKMTLYTCEDFERTVKVCSEKLSELLPREGSCLLACLGNRQITADAQGPMCANHFIVSRHIKDNSPSLFSSLMLRETMCVVPDVLGNTGIEAASIVKGIVDKMKPSFVIAVDSLAARKTSRVGTTLQMSNAGIAPGSGVGNHRTALNFRNLGVPVISIGIPTVVDAATVGADILEEAFDNPEFVSLSRKQKSDILNSVLKTGNYGYFVTPKNADVISKSAARLIGFTINKALNPDLEFAEIEELTG